jgi:hypothetical protein
MVVNVGQAVSKEEETKKKKTQMRFIDFLFGSMTAWNDESEAASPSVAAAAADRG